MEKIIIILVIFAILAVIGFLIKQFGIQKARMNPYFKADSLLTPAELNFFNVLKGAISDDCYIVCKIRLADIIKVDRNLPRSEYQTAFNKIQSKHVDFVICNSSDMSTYCVIELDDKSHGKPSRQARDDFVDSALKWAGIPILHIPVKKSYNTTELQEYFINIQSQESPKPENFEDGNMTCPKCGAEMILRTAQKGKNAGNQFWGCTNYPNCREIINIE